MYGLYLKLFVNLFAETINSASESYLPRAFSIGNAIYRRPCGRYNARPTKNVNEDKPVLTLYDEKERGPVRNQTAYVFLLKRLRSFRASKNCGKVFRTPYCSRAPIRPCTRTSSRSRPEPAKTAGPATAEHPAASRSHEERPSWPDADGRLSFEGAAVPVILRPRRLLPAGRGASANRRRGA